MDLYYAPWKAIRTSNIAWSSTDPFFVAVLVAEKLATRFFAKWIHMLDSKGAAGVAEMDVLSLRWSATSACSVLSKRDMVSYRILIFIFAGLFDKNTRYSYDFLISMALQHFRESCARMYQV